MMQQREHLEGRLITATAQLHDAAICGLAANNVRTLRCLIKAAEDLINEAESIRPQHNILTFPGGKPSR